MDGDMGEKRGEVESIQKKKRLLKGKMNWCARRGARFIKKKAAAGGGGGGRGGNGKRGEDPGGRESRGPCQGWKSSYNISVGGEGAADQQGKPAEKRYFLEKTDGASSTYREEFG